MSPTIIAPEVLSPYLLNYPHNSTGFVDRKYARDKLIVSKASLDLQSDSHSHFEESKDVSCVKVDSPISSDDPKCTSNNVASDGGNSLTLAFTLVEMMRSIPRRVERLLPMVIRIQPVSEGPDDEDQSDFTY